MSFAQHYTPPDNSRSRYSTYDQFSLATPPFSSPGPSRLQRTQSLSADQLGAAAQAGYFTHPDAARPPMHHYTYGTNSTNGAHVMDLDEAPAMTQAGLPHLLSPHSPHAARFSIDAGSAQPARPPQAALPIVKVCSVEPAAGTAGTPVKVVINVHPSPSQPIRSFRVTFGTLDATTRVAFEHRASAVEHVELLATAPMLQGPLRTGRVALLVQAVDARETTLASAEAGPFEYLAASMPGPYPPAPAPTLSQAAMGPTNPRKRFGEPLPGDRAHTRSNRLSLDYTHATSRPLTSPPSIVSPRAPLMPSFSSPAMSFQSSNSADNPMFSPPDPTRSPDVTMGDPLRLGLDGSSEALDASGSARSAGAPARQHPNITSPDPGQPFLLRTSQINGSPSSSRPVATSKSEVAAPVVPPGAKLSSKAVLHLEGDIHAMAVGWTQEEWEAKRRLVQFWRQQEGNVIKATFRPIRAGEYRQHAIVISCIFREDKNECFVTSVDTIYLLEALIATRFTVEEKNRIRRNLEGFKPITVTKSKPDSEAFFKLIMGFPNPKPRNIEKDVKVFPWKILATALKKIISKYSAAYVPETDSGSSPLTAHSPEQAISRPASRKSSRDELMADAPRIAPPTPLTAFPPSLAFSPMPGTSGSMSPALPSPGHSPTAAVFPTHVTAAYHSPYQADPRATLLSGHHRSYSDTSSLTLKGLSANQFGPDFATHPNPGHQRSRTTLDGSLGLPFLQHLPQQQAHAANSVPVSPVTLNTSIPELPFMRSVSHGNLSNMTLLADFHANGQHTGRRPSSAGLVEEHSISYTPLGFEEDVELVDAERNGHY